MESLLLHDKGMVVTNLLQYLTGPIPNGEEDVEIESIFDTMWMIQNPQWVSNSYCISDANK